MAQCPACGARGAYVGFNSIECHNPKCIHFVIEEEAICPCCGKRGHVPGEKTRPGKAADEDLGDPLGAAPGEGEEAPF